MRIAAVSFTTSTKGIVMSEQIYQNRLLDHERTRCEVWTRVMGYHRPVSEFNPGKQAEYSERKQFAEPCLIAENHA